MKEIKECPLCKNDDFESYLHTLDYFLTQEDFHISKCKSCGFIFTNPIPNERDLGRYYKSEEYLSHTNKKNSLKDYLYQIVKTRNLRKKYKTVCDYAGLNKGRILDYGSASGDLLAFFKSKDWEVRGIEADRESRDHAITKHDIKVFGDKSGLDLEQFDVITLWHVLEHVADLDQSLEFFHAHLHTKGKLFLALPNIDSWDARHYGKYWAALDVPRHLYHFNKQSVERLLSRQGFQLTAVLPMHFDAYFIALLSEKYKHGRLDYFSAFIKGMRSNIHARKNRQYSSLLYVLEKV
ncbi:MAG: class I SAM-dependent methyltransferase [Bacteroidota bacterium]|nr:class I SAM-dependent methyltransferase [Bacteroidota bacterium]